jgi:two-component system sensor histidine kinase HydH
VTVEPATLRFRTDPDLLRHVLGNLVRNSVEAAIAGGETKVNVAASLTPDEVVVAVEDNGPGIPEGTMDKVFESFYTTKSFGTGLGLPIARSLTAALGGQLLLRARKGGGTRAEVHLPAAGAYSVTEV